MFLTKLEFSNVIEKTPLIAIDLCILKEREVMLGKRINPPAKDFFFVPGGRILKSELIKDALKRILKNEIGLKIKNNNFRYVKNLGIYEHFYDNNFLDNFSYSTHYVVLAYLIPYQYLTPTKEEIISEQHSEYIWYNVENINHKSFKIHNYTLDYLKNPLINSFKSE